MKGIAANSDNVLFSGKLHHGCLYTSKLGDAMRVMRVTPGSEITFDETLTIPNMGWFFGLREVNRKDYKYLAFPLEKDIDYGE